LKAEREFNDTWKDYITGEGAMDAITAQGTGPKAAEAKARVTAKKNEIRKGAYAMVQGNPSGGSGVMSAADKILAGQ
jgi:hypothetical protein